MTNQDNDDQRASDASSKVRIQVLCLIVKQALVGVPWREICAGPMKVNNITPEDVETEIEKWRSGDTSLQTRARALSVSPKDIAHSVNTWIKNNPPRGD